MIFGGVGDAYTTKNHYMNTTIVISMRSLKLDARSVTPPAIDEYPILERGEQTSAFRATP